MPRRVCVCVGADSTTDLFMDRRGDFFLLLLFSCSYTFLCVCKELFNSSLINMIYGDKNLLVLGAMYALFLLQRLQGQRVVAAAAVGFTALRQWHKEIEGHKSATFSSM